MEMQSLTFLPTILALRRWLGRTVGRAVAVFLANTTFPSEGTLNLRVRAIGLVVACCSLALNMGMWNFKGTLVDYN